MGLAPQTNLELGSVSEWPEVKAALAAELKDYANGSINVNKNTNS